MKALYLGGTLPGFPGKILSCSLYENRSYAGISAPAFRVWYCRCGCGSYYNSAFLLNAHLPLAIRFNRQLSKVNNIGRISHGYTRIFRFYALNVLSFFLAFTCAKLWKHVRTKIIKTKRPPCGGLRFFGNNVVTMRLFWRLLRQWKW